jgi:hypothetical protein
MVWAKAGPQHNPTTDASSQIFFMMFLPRFDNSCTRCDIAPPAHEGHDAMDLIEF